jgi:hypothetical protein
MKTYTNQLLLKLTKFLTGHLSRMDIVAWARDQMVSVPDRNSAHEAGPLLFEVLNALSLLPREDCREYAPARATLFDYKNRLEHEAGHGEVR